MGSLTVAGTKMRGVVFLLAGAILGAVVTLVGTLWMVLGIGQFEGSEHFWE